MKTKLLIAALMLLPLTGCASKAYRSPVVTPQPMRCTDGKDAQFTLHSPDNAVLVFEGRTYDVDRIVTASGAKYGNKRISIWNKGIDALITRADGTMITCIHLPKHGL